MVLLVSMFACCFRLIFRLFLNILTTNLCNICKKQYSTYSIGYTKVNIFVRVVFNISMLHVNEFAIQGADRFVAPFW